MHKHAIIATVRFLIFLTVLAMTTASFSCAARSADKNTTHTQGNTTSKPFTVILDAGHGGEDGGAVSASGIFEKDLNLAVAQKLKTLFEANGVKVIMTRETDTLLYDKSIDYKWRKKALDLAARLEIGENTPGSIFISIHMNAYPLPQYHGLQVWYSLNHSQSVHLAKSIQTTVRETLQPQNERTVKPATSSIYLLYHLSTPSVLVECGFLSNETEAGLLKDSDYQNRLAIAIFLGIMEAQTTMENE